MCQIYDFYPAHVHAISIEYGLPLPVIWRTWKSMSLRLKAQYLALPTVQERMDKVILENRAKGIISQGGF